jgi:hypothetical protein
MGAELDEFYEEVCAAILAELDKHADAPIKEVTRDVAEGMLLGEDEDVAVEIRRKLGI